LLAGEEHGRVFQGELVQLEWTEVSPYFVVEEVPAFAVNLYTQAKAILNTACKLTGRPNPFASDMFRNVSGK
jgi:hypothetical protein